jgi:hypothetical protein
MSLLIVCAVVGIPTVADTLAVADLFSAVSAAVHSILLPLNLLSSNPMFWSKWNILKGFLQKKGHIL